MFASIMTSNLVFVSLAAVKADATLGQHCVTALVCYIAGAATGSAFAPPTGRKAQLGTRRLTALLVAEAVLLAAYGAWWAARGSLFAGWQQLALLGAATFAMGVQGAAARQLGDPDAGTTYVTGALTGMIAAVAAGRRPDAGAGLAIVGIVAGAAIGAGLLQTVPDLTPLVAVLGVAFVAGLSGMEYRRVQDSTRTSPGHTDALGS